jgi:hypothetical protein
VTEPDLFAWEPSIKAPAQRHSETSVAAAMQIEKHIGPLHRRILDYLAAHPEGATDDELQTALDMNPSTQRPRRIELAAAGKIENFGTTRPTRSGRAATIWHMREK